MANDPQLLANIKQMILERRFQDAVRACRRELLSHPAKYDVRLMLGHALMALSRYDDVRTEMQVLLRSAPEYGAAHRVLGEAYLRLKREDEAATSLRSAMHLDENDTEARALLAELEGRPPASMSIDQRFTDETTKAETSDLQADPSLPTMSSPEFDDPTHTSNHQLPEYEPSVALDSEFEQEVFDQLDELEGEATIMTTPEAYEALKGDDTRGKDGPPGDAETYGRPGALPGAPALPGDARGKSSVLARDETRGKPRTPVHDEETRGRAPKLRAPTIMGIGHASLKPAVSDPGFQLDTDDLMSAAEDLVSMSAELVIDDLEDEPTRARAPDEMEDEKTRQREPKSPQVPSSQGSPPLASAPLASAPLPSAPLPSAPLPQPSAPLPSPAGPLPSPAGPLPSPAWPPPAAAPPPRAGPPGAPSFSPDLWQSAMPEGFGQSQPAFALPPSQGPPSSFPGSSSGPVASAPPPPSALPPRAGPPPQYAAPVLGSSTPLPELESEATLARAPVDPFPKLVASATPMIAPPRQPDFSPPVNAPTPIAAAPAPPAETKKQAKRKNRATEVIKKHGAGLRERWPPAVLVALLGVPVLLVATLFYAYRSYTVAEAEREVSIAARRAANVGTLPLVQQAIALDAEAGSNVPLAVARRAFLYSLAAIEHGAPEEERVLSLAELAPGDTSLEALARAYIALEQGDVGRAEELLEPFDENEVWGEVAFARAMAAYRVGDSERAVTLSRAAQALQPSATRYTAFMVRALIAGGETQDAEQLAMGLAGADGPLVDLARAEVKIATGDYEAGSELASSVVDAADASDRQRALAHLFLAESAAAQDQAEEATTHIEAAFASEEPSDEGFVLDAIQVYLRIGNSEAATALIPRLASNELGAARRAITVAAVYLQAEDYEAAEAALASAPDSPRTAFMRGQLAEAQGDIPAAKRSYEAAAASPEEAFRARMRLGAMALSAGEAAVAVAELERVRTNREGDAEFVLLLVRAYLANDDNDAATAAVRSARAASPNDTRIRAAEADIQMASGDYEEALTTLTALVETSPTDVTLQGTLGDAARLSGSLERAAAAYDAALARNPRDSRSLNGKVALAMSSGDTDAMEAAINAAATGGVTDLALPRAQLTLLRAEGRAAVEAFDALVNNRTRDVSLLVGLGQAHLQAASLGSAKSVFQRALRIEPRNMDVIVGIAFVETRRGRLRAAGQILRRARRAITGPRDEARLAVARGRIALEYGRLSDAAEAGQAALVKDPESAEAHFLLAMTVDAQGRDSTEHLTRALAGHGVTPEMLGQMVIHGPREGRCDLAARYMDASPEGVDSRDVQRIAGRCR
ncbi:MAG: tetratricopeptide (TPR) repeat protein [Polyangiales bacterium]|jgi:tetratricopeptide (TPR) repeat protein